MPRAPFIPDRAPGGRSPGRAGVSAVVVWFAALAAFAPPEAAASQGEMRRAGERYVANDVTGTIAILNDIIGRRGGTLWMGEALFLRAKIEEKDLGLRRSALRDLRRLTVEFSGTAAAAFGQFRIARLYESAGAPADAYREYVLCSRLRGFTYRPRETTREPPAPGDVPGPRMTPAGARELVELARERAACLFGSIPAPAAGRTPLPPGTFVVADARKPLNIPPDPARRSASGERTDVWYALAPHGRSIAGVSVELVAVVDPAAAGPQARKHYTALVEPLPRVPDGRSLALYGRMRRSETLSGALRLDGGASALKISLYRSGARVLGCKVRVTLKDGPAAPPDPPEPPAGFAFAVTPGPREGAGGVAIARAAGGNFYLVYHSPGPGPGEPDDDADLFLATSAEGRTWGKPRRLSVSSAADDRDPALAILRDGRLLLAWTSDGRGPGSGDVFLSTSRDGEKWSDASRLPVAPRDLEGMGVGASPRVRVVRPGAHVVLHKPEISVDSAGRVRVFFVAHGYRHDLQGKSRARTLSATGLFAVVSTDLERWTKPIPIIATPRVHLDRFRPAPKGREPEVVSAAARPAVIEREPGRSLVAWLSTRGRVFLSMRDSNGRWAHTDSRFAGADAASAAEAVRLLGPAADKSYGVLVLRRDVGPMVFWRDRNERSGWRTCRLEAEPPRAGRAGAPDRNAGAYRRRPALGEAALAPLPGGRRWMSAWTAAAASRPGGVYVREIAAPEGKRQKRR